MIERTGGHHIGERRGSSLLLGAMAAPASETTRQGQCRMFYIRDFHYMYYHDSGSVVKFDFFESGSLG